MCLFIQSGYTRWHEIIEQAVKSEMSLLIYIRFEFKLMAAEKGMVTSKQRCKIFEMPGSFVYTTLWSVSYYLGLFYVNSLMVIPEDTSTRQLNVPNFFV